MKDLNKNTSHKTIRPERIIQFGEGNFLRAFVDWIIWKMNQQTDFNSSVVVVQPIEQGMVNTLNEQDGQYHLILKGIDKGEKVYDTQLIDVISRGINPYTEYSSYLKLAENPDMRFIISNTTEAGIAFNPEDSFHDRPAKSYPGKLVQLLHHRYTSFNGAKDKGFIIFPCELIFENGRILKEMIFKYISHWSLEEDFKKWVEEACSIHSTLVDRIVPGYPRDRAEEINQTLGYKDKLLVEGEIFHLWVIEAPKHIAQEFPADQAGLNVLFVPSEEPYHQRKVTLLNGPHTVLSPVGYLAGLNTVAECVNDELIGRYVNKVMFDELMQTVNLPKNELEQFSNDVLDRFRNPYVNHRVTSIMLNSFSKFKTRDLPGLKLFTEKKGILPDGLVLGLAGMITYYKGGLRGEDEIKLQDDPQIITFLKELWKTNDLPSIAKDVLGAEFIWDEDLNQINGLTDRLTYFLSSIQKNGMRATVKEILK